MKKYDKKNLVMVDAYMATEDGTLITPVGDTVAKLNELETELQQAYYERHEEKPKPIKKTQFERVSIFDDLGYKVSTETPNLDKRVDEAQKIMDEIDDYHRSKIADLYVAKYNRLLVAIDRDYVIADEEDRGPIDTPMLGDPLKLTAEKIMRAIAYIVGYEDAQTMDVERLEGDKDGEAEN